MTLAVAFDSLKPIGRPETLAHKVNIQLKEAVMAGRFSPGQKLTIRGVASALEVSLTPAREALYHLAAEGVLEMRPNGSVYVPELTEDRIIELTKIRVSLEGLASREAVIRITEPEISKISKLNDAIIEADKKSDYSKLMALNWQFHFSIYQASRMEHLIRLIEGCWMMSGSYLNVIYPEFGEVSDGINNHIHIVRALQARDGDRMASAINMDINLAADALLGAVRQKSPPEIP